MGPLGRVPGGLDLQGKYSGLRPRSPGVGRMPVPTQPPQQVPFPLEGCQAVRRLPPDIPASYSQAPPQAPSGAPAPASAPPEVPKVPGGATSPGSAQGLGAAPATSRALTETGRSPG